MSAILCGKFIFDRPRSHVEQTEFAFRIAGEALARKLNLQLGPGVVQRIVFEMFGENDRALKERYLYFLITDSPISDTSHNLVVPELPGPWQQFWPLLKEIFDRIQSTLLAAFEIGGLSEIQMIISLGYDVNYPEATVPIVSLSETCLRAFQQNPGDVPSLRLRILMH